MRPNNHLGQPSFLLQRKKVGLTGKKDKFLKEKSSLKPTGKEWG
jgi:hypothetical protein